MADIIKGFIGKEDFILQTNTDPPEKFERGTSVGGTTELYKMPDIWDGTGRVNVAAWIDATAYATLELANTAAYNAGKALLIYSNWTLTANTTLTASVIVLKGGSFTKASTYTLTINGPFEAGLYQVFSGFTQVYFNNGITNIYPDWFGNNTIPGTTDMTTALKAAIGSAEVSADFVRPSITLGGTTYLVSERLVIAAKVNFIGVGMFSTKLLWGGADDEYMVEMNAMTECKLTNMTLDGGPTRAGRGIWQRSAFALLENVRIINVRTFAIYNHCLALTMINCELYKGNGYLEFDYGAPACTGISHGLGSGHKIFGCYVQGFDIGITNHTAMTVDIFNTAFEWNKVAIDMKNTLGYAPRYRLYSPLFEENGNSVTWGVAGTHIQMGDNNADGSSYSPRLFMYGIDFMFTTGNPAQVFTRGWLSGFAINFNQDVTLGSTLTYANLYDYILLGFTLTNNIGGTSAYVLIDSNGNIETSKKKRVSAQFNKTDATLADITGLTVRVSAGDTYSFKAVLYVNADVIGGHKYAISGTCTATAITYDILSTDIGSPGQLRLSSRQTALNGAAGQAGQTVYKTIIEGTITVATSGYLEIQFAQNVANGTSSVLVGSYISVEKMK